MTRTPVRVALTGARGGFGRTFLAQLRSIDRMTATQLIDPDVDGVRTLIADLGGLPDAEPIPGHDDVRWDEIDVLVEASGRVEAGYRYAAEAISRGIHVVMVSKEIESVAGVSLAKAARERGVGYLPGDGDQPANLLRLLDWVEKVGLHVVALGKSGEYDLVFDPATGILDQQGERIDASGLGDHLFLAGDIHETLAVRAAIVAPLKRAAAADSCEMAVVSLYSGATADTERMHYPVARPSELADIYARRSDGGLIDTDRAVDVFSALRLPGETSFAGGVFTIVTTGDDEVWELLAGKGHIVSRSGDYACIYWPYHFMGVETPLTIDAVASGATPFAEPRHHTVLAARASEPLAAGTTFEVRGHHHEIDGVRPVIIDRADALSDTDDALAAAYYLLSGARLVREVAEGELIRISDLEGVADDVRAAFVEGVRL
ncbi:homoserine dehydrogenase [Microbacterium sp. APC 3901]|uniref:homoserine dehydrogenase n=1 Tax=Microbacterium sp. APC 3901 TaxID=3035192 RepID=UPI0025B50BC4|nr:homoserine dehydrogenase [Microbacterium sp. APC 3901]MDN3445446.1 homoserine dehydrogenase [Microbacterium sp. APC 3901]